MKTTKTLMAIALMLMPFIGKAQTDSLPTLRAVTSSYWLEEGESHLTDTYLSPLHYHGTHTALRYERTQPMPFNPEKWVMQLRAGAEVDRTKNPAGNATMYDFDFDFGWGMMRRFAAGPITIGVGGGTTLDGGFLYARRNSNNPASGKIVWSLDATGYASWSCRLGRMPLTLRYQPTLPVIGCFFAPDYGQLYYQIYLGETEHLVHLSWWGNHFKLDNLLTADLHFGRSTLRLGYHNHIFSSKINNLVTQRIYHAVVIGVTTEWIALRPNSKGLKTNIISAY